MTQDVREDTSSGKLWSGDASGNLEWLHLHRRLDLERFVWMRDVPGVHHVEQLSTSG
jgi:hypothetical protein